jgi:hypothetical protein
MGSPLLLDRDQPSPVGRRLEVGWMWVGRVADSTGAGGTCVFALSAVCVRPARARSNHQAGRAWAYAGHVGVTSPVPATIAMEVGWRPNIAAT